MRLLSWNVNGIRAAARKGLLDWLARERPDALCLQEVKARPEQVPGSVREPEGYHAAWNPADRPGYSGVATLQRERPGYVRAGFGDERFDDEGRVLVTEVADVRLYNVYFPNGKQGPERLRYKLGFYDAFLDHLREEKRRRRRLVVCGDYNTAHREIDLAHPRQNERVSGFLPEERAWLNRLVAAGFADTFRLIHPAEPGQYTWWSPLTRARERNVGWRIDYFFVSENLVRRVRDAFILPEVEGSDHCPVGLELAE
ncbi:MAG: exodeoxyribonuclease III [bacterium]